MTDTMKLKNGIRVHQIYDTKFNEVLVNLKISFPLEPYQNSVAQLLIRMIGDRTENYPTKKLMREKLDTMYGASVGINTYALGVFQIIDISIRAIQNYFVDEDLLLEECKLLAELIYRPLLNESLLEEAKRDMIMYHARIKENTASFAQIQAFKNAAKDQVFSINSIGEESDIETISLDDIKEFHNKLINEFSKDIYIVGHNQKVTDLSMFDQGRGAVLTNPMNATTVTARMDEMTHPGNQTELIQVYSTDIHPHHELYEAYLVFVALLGQLPSSYLFRNIREEHSLAYRIFASRQVFDCVMFIGTSISDKNLDLTQKLIAEQFDKMKRETLEIESAIEYLTSNLMNSNESLKNICDFTYRNDLLNDTSSIEDVVEKIKKVTENDVKTVMDHISEPYVFAYRGEKDE